MLIAKATADDGDTLIILGLSRVNIEKLLAGQPMMLRRKTHGDGIPEKLSIAIVFGETELSIKQAFEDIGAIKPETKVFVDPRLK